MLSHLGVAHQKTSLALFENPPLYQALKKWSLQSRCHAPIIVPRMKLCMTVLKWNARCHTCTYETRTVKNRVSFMYHSHIVEIETPSYRFLRLDA